MQLMVLVLVAGALLAVAGAQKALDPAGAAGALRTSGLPVPALVVRVAAAGELALGVAALTVGGAPILALAAASYAAFAAFVVVALRSGSPISSCGCFGRADTPPTLGHVVLNASLAAALLAAALTDATPPLEIVVEEGLAAAVPLVVAGLLGYLAWAVYAVLPDLVRAQREATSS